MRAQAVKWLRQPFCFDQPFTQRPFGLIFFFYFVHFATDPSLYIYISSNRSVPLLLTLLCVFVYWGCVCVCSGSLTTPCPSTLHVATATTRPGHTGWTCRHTGGREHVFAFLSLLFSRDLGSLPGNGVFHSLQLLQELLTARQCVAGLARSRARARASTGGRPRTGARGRGLAQGHGRSFPR